MKHLVRRISIAAFIAAVLCLPIAAQQTQITGRVVGISDGDTITVLDGSKADRLTLLRMYTLYEMAAIHETAGDDEPMQFFDHGWALPVSEKLKQTVVNNVRAI